MNYINFYDPALALSNYQIGDVYTFYIHNPNMKRLVKVRKFDYEPYVKNLENAIAMNNNINNVPYLNFTRSIGIIVDTYKATRSEEIDFITVLFKTASGKFVLNKYVVNSSPSPMSGSSPSAAM